MMWPLIHKTPIRTQVNPIECGAVVLGIALEYYGHYFSAEHLNKVVKVSRHGTDAASLIHAAAKLGLEATAEHTLVSDLKAQKSLSILFVDNSHFVIFEGYFWGKFFINDPALGRYTLKRDELRRRFSNVQIIIKTTPQLGCMLKRRSVSLTMPPSFFSWSLLGLFIGLLLFIVALGLGLRQEISELWLSIGLFLVSIALALSVLFFMSMRLRHKARNAKDYGDWLINNIGLVRPNFFCTRPFASFSGALKTFSNLLETGGRDHTAIVTLISMMLVIGVALGLTSWPLGIIAIALCAGELSLGLFKTRGPLLSPPSSSWFDHYPDLAAMGQNHRLYSQQMTQALRAEFKSNAFEFRLAAYVPLGLALVSFFWVASSPIQGQALLSSEIVVSLVLICSLAFISSVLATALRSCPDYEIKALLSEVHEQVLKPRNLAPHEGSLLKITKGSFSYPGQKEPVLSAFELKIERSRIYSLVGGPLAGTTTLLKLLGQELAFSDETQILMAWDLRIALINDEVDLFEGTLIENVRLFDLTMKEHEVIAALKQACSEELFYNRPMGLLAPIYVGGSNVSGGQKKRLLLARALAHQPDLLLLDNFFETLEPPLAIKILTNLRSQGITTVFSTHRPLEQELSDQVISLRKSHE